MKAKRSRSHSKDGDIKSPIPKRRKRSRSSSQDITRQRAPSTDVDNKRKPVNSKQETVVHHISKFLSAESKEDVTSILFLVHHLESSTNAKEQQSDVTITQEDIATLLLPWSVARLMRAASDTTSNVDEIVWRNLSCCLTILTSNNEHNTATLSQHETTLNNSLSQSTLAKIVRAAATCAFEGNTTQVQGYASNCFLKLVKRYRPSFEVACTSLLEHVEDLVYKDMNSVVSLPKHQYEVVYGALETIHSLLAGANVKRSFAVLSSVEMLPRLGHLGCVKCTLCPDENQIGNVQALVEKIVRDGLFHQTHHMDGFRTMEELRGVPPLPKTNVNAETMEVQSNKKKAKSATKACYQSGLFKSLRVLLSDAAPKDIMATAKLLPILIHGFFEHVKFKQEKNSKNGLAVSAEADAQLQFYFWANATIAAFESIRTDVGLNANLDASKLEMASETLKIILDYDAYSPSYSDPDETLVSYLQFVTQRILGCIQGCDAASESSVCLLSSVRTLLLLNHRLLHEQLSKCIAFTCNNLHQGSDNEKISADASSVLQTIVKTYGELRQTGYFLSAARCSFEDMKSSNYDPESMYSLLYCNDAMGVLVRSYQTLPTGQLHELWDFYNGWIVAIADEKTAGASTELVFANRMFTLYIKSIRADKHNSSELRHLCEKAMTSSVGKLLDTSKDHTRLFMRQGIDLCGWLVDLHTRSCFWIDSITVDGDGSAFLLDHGNASKKTLNVLSHLRDVATKTVDSEDFKSWTEKWKQSSFHYHQQVISGTETSLSVQASLLRLAMHRIHQLHSMIYYCKVKEHEGNEISNSKDKSSRGGLTKEARLLVNFVVYTAQVSGKSSVSEFESETMWSTVAQSLGTWAHYAERHHMKVFLSWFFFTLSGNESENAEQQQDKACSFALVRDASFYEVRECTSLLIEEGLLHIFGNISQCFDDSSALKCILNSESTDIAPSCTNLASQLKPKSVTITESTAKSISTVLSYLSSAPLDCISSMNTLKLLDKAIGFDVLLSKIAEMKIPTTTQEKSSHALVKALCGMRCLVSGLLPRVVLSSNKSDGSLLTLTTKHLINSCCIFNESTEIALVTGDVLSELFSVCIDHHEKDINILHEFLNQLDSIGISIGKAAPSGFAVRASLIRCVLRRMNVISRRQSMGKTVQQLCINTALSCCKNTWHKIIDQINNRNPIPTHNKAAATSLLLASEILALTASDKLSLTSHDVDAATEHTKELLYLVTNTDFTPEDSEFNTAAHYFLSSMLATNDIRTYGLPPTSIIKTLLGAMEISDSPLLEAALYSILRESTAHDLKYVTSHISTKNNASTPNHAFAVKVYHILIHCVKNQEQMAYLSSQSVPILMTTMGLLQEPNNMNRSYTTTLFSSIMTSLITRKDLLLLSGREIAMICGGLSSTFNDQRVNQEGIAGEATEFKSYSSVVSALLTNYPKQLYGCPNALFGLLLPMLDHVLRSNPKNGLNLKALEYAK